MPQMQRPLFPKGVTPITGLLSFVKEGARVVYFNGSLPVFTHDERDLDSFRMICDKSIPWLPIDASRCNWIATANDPESLHPAIRSRFVEVEVTSPSEDALLNLLQKLYSDLLAEFSLADRFPEMLPPEQAGVLLGGSIRDAKRLLRSAVAQALRDGRGAVTLMRPAPHRVSRQRIGFV